MLLLLQGDEEIGLYGFYTATPAEVCTWIMVRSTMFLETEFFDERLRSVRALLLSEKHYCWFGYDDAEMQFREEHE